ncbi:RnfABCDGE type electron transport complex subunit D [Pelagibacterium montanilacus]|uniref:RnfABCDGE type electron transport complex subunit D n=1 Tax=Pelagibacterium montanilacus TaxID=2185280 RepID=UPI0013E095A6|nr:RnfABCDGE type electron transport complex subunit D [Pelagibacterium montanilacus]
MIRGLYHRDTVGWLIAAAVLPVLAATVVEQGVPALERMGLTLVVVLVWQAVFLWVRAQPASATALVTAIAVGVLAPGDFAVWQIVLAVSFGTVIGEQIFGGWGRNIINVGVATLAFLYFAFPETLHEGAGPLVAAACIPGALLLLATGILAPAVLLASAVGAGVVTLGLDQNPVELVVNGSLVFGLVFLVCDPVASAATRGGRWVFGLLAGGLIALFAFADAGSDVPHAVVFAALLASLFAPLIDAAVIALSSSLRRRRHG